ncbi:MAG: bifunctional phosphoserine phosphatase/homoserine phosphotransferase ThrH [Acidimicrobiaceae bacterium]|nr:bifunctional phosphoserine phosphatase/homoserine phosphotransferase ThrH [Acidimicrobiaceae bacterium]
MTVGRQSLAVLDLEGVLTPEIWIAVAERTGLDSLRRTTRDEPDIDALFSGRIEALDAAGIKLDAILEVIEGMTPLEGAVDFLGELRSRLPVLVLSDTFEQFGRPLTAKLGEPAMLCHRLIEQDGRLAGYRLRIANQKQRAVEAFQSLNYRVVAVGDSYNDVTMLTQADAGVLFRASAKVASEHPQFPSCDAYRDLLAIIDEWIAAA